MNNHNNLFDFCFVEYEEYTYEQLRIDIPFDLFKRGLCVENESKISFIFTGIAIVNNQLIVVFPKGYILPTDLIVLKKHIRVLIKTLDRYNTEVRTTFEEEDYFLNPKGTSINLGSINFLIDDFIENGILTFKTKEYSLNKNHNIHWPRTINKTIPIISNKTPYYLEWVNKSNQIDHNHIISLIHLRILNEVIDMMGWLYDLDEDFLSPVDLIIDYELWIHLINLELDKTYDDRTIQVLINLKNYLLGSSTSDTKNKFHIFATKYFQNVWEKICLYAFVPSMEGSYELPHPYWAIPNRKPKYTEQIPDIIFEEKNQLFILDAKYYQTKFAPAKLPGWKDLVKQFFYKDSLNYQNKINVFLFPGTVEDKISYLGFAAIETQEYKYGKIYGVILDNHFIIENYAYHKGQNIRRLLIQLISSL